MNAAASLREGAAVAQARERVDFGSVTDLLGEGWRARARPPRPGQGMGPFEHLVEQRAAAARSNRFDPIDGYVKRFELQRDIVQLIACQARSLIERPHARSARPAPSCRPRR